MKSYVLTNTTTNSRETQATRAPHEKLWRTIMVAALLLPIMALARPAQADAIKVACNTFNHAIVEGRTLQINCTVTSLVFGTRQPKITGIRADAAQQPPKPEEDKILVGGTDPEKGPVAATGSCFGYTFSKGNDTCSININLPTADKAPLGHGDPDMNDLSNWKVVLQVTDSLDLAKVFGDSWDVTVNDQPTPEPASLLLFGSGVLGFSGFLRRQMRPRS